MKRVFIVSVVFLTVTVWTGHVIAETPRATKSTLANGATDVEVDMGRNIFLKLYREQYQGAFYMLIPKGWKAEGSMIPNGVQWNVVDLVENNIRFRVTSPDGKSFFGWYPPFYFQDPARIKKTLPENPSGDLPQSVKNYPNIAAACIQANRSND